MVWTLSRDIMSLHDDDDDDDDDDGHDTEEGDTRDKK